MVSFIGILMAADQGWSPCCSLLMASSLSCSRPVTYLVAERRRMVRTIFGMMALMMMPIILIMVKHLTEWLLSFDHTKGLLHGRLVLVPTKIGVMA